MSDKRKEEAAESDWKLIARGGPALVLDRETPFEIWYEIGNKLRYMNKFVQFKLGDWLNFGFGAYGEKSSQAMIETGRDEQTLRNYAWVCGKVAPEARNLNLSFGHHALVAKYDSFIQIEELGVAEAQKMSVEEFRMYLRGKYAPKKDGEDGERPVRKTDKEYLEQILNITRERKIKAVPSKEDIAWMAKAISSIQNVCSAALEE